MHNIPTDTKWADTIVVNTTEYRFPNKINWNQLQTIYGSNNLLFVNFEENHYTHFKTNTTIDINYYKPSSLFELSVILNSCRLFIGTLSSPLSVALSLYRPCIIGFNFNSGDLFYRLFFTLVENMNLSYYNECENAVYLMV